MQCFILFDPLRLNPFERGPPAYRFPQNVVGLRGPDKWLGIVVVRSDVSLDRLRRLSHAAKHSAVQPVDGDAAEEPLDHVQP